MARVEQLTADGRMHPAGLAAVAAARANGAWAALDEPKPSPNPPTSPQHWTRTPVPLQNSAQGSLSCDLAWSAG